MEEKVDDRQYVAVRGGAILHLIRADGTVRAHVQTCRHFGSKVQLLLWQQHGCQHIHFALPLGPCREVNISLAYLRTQRAWSIEHSMNDDDQSAPSLHPEASHGASID